MRTLISWIGKFRGSAAGVAATEFALVLPFLAAIVITLPDVAQAASGMVGMNSAVRASIQYAMGGGSDMSVAQTVGNAAWSNKPNNAQLTATSACLCNGGAGTCGQLCPDSSTPQTFVTVVASGYVGGTTVGFNDTITRKVRIQ